MNGWRAACVTLEWTRDFHKKSMEILWKSFNNILSTAYDSTIGRIEIYGDPDSTIGRKKPQKRVLVLNVRIR